MLLSMNQSFQKHNIQEFCLKDIKVQSCIIIFAQHMLGNTRPRIIYGDLCGSGKISSALPFGSNLVASFNPLWHMSYAYFIVKRFETKVKQMGRRIRLKFISLTSSPSLPLHIAHFPPLEMISSKTIDAFQFVKEELVLV